MDGGKDGSLLLLLLLVWEQQHGVDCFAAAGVTFG